MSTERKYLLWLLGLLVACLGVLAGFNWLMNPHRFFDAPEIPGINLYKTYTPLMRMRKPVHLYQRAPTTLIVGSSRAGEGLHCEYLPVPPAECYNTAIRGITPYEQRRIVEHAVVSARAAHKRINRIILNLGYATFTETELTKEGFEAALFARESDHPLLGEFSLEVHKAVLDKLLYALFSWEALDASRNTRFFQDKPQGWFATGVLSFEADGSWRSHPLPQTLADPEWVHQKMKGMWGAAATGMNSGYAQLKTHVDQAERFEHNYEHFEKMLDLIYRENISLDIMLSPAHVEYLRIMDRHGLWPYEEEWKRRVVAINERLAAHYQVAPYRIWDFEDINEYSTEPVWEDLPVGQAMQWNKDIVHFSEALGAKMLSVVSRVETDGNWYHMINSHNLDAHLQALRAGKDAYFQAHPETGGNP